MWIDESGFRADEFEPAIGKLLVPEIGEFLDKPVFSGHYSWEINPHRLHPNTPGIRVPGQVRDLGRVKERLRRHATAQDAESADLLATFNHDGPQSGRSSSPGRGITAAATADHRDIVIKCVFHREKNGAGAERVQMDCVWL